MPESSRTPLTAFRLPTQLKAAAAAKAKAEGRTLTDVVVAALQRYVRTPPKSS